MNNGEKKSSKKEFYAKVLAGVMAALMVFGVVASVLVYVLA